MSNNVEVILSAKDAQLVRAWMNGKKSIDAYEASLRKIDPAQQKNAKSAAAFDKQLQGVVSSGLQVLTGWMSVQTAISVATQYLNEFMEANKKAAEESEDAAKKQEFRRKRFQVQSGVGPLAAIDAQKDLRKIAEETATSNEDVTDIAVMLKSSGATDAAARGGGTKAIAEFIKAQGLKGDQVNAESFTDDITKFLLGTGQELNEANIEKLVKQLQSQGLKETKFKIPDLKFWAKEAQSLKNVGGMSPEDILAIAGQTSGALDPEHAGRQVREMVKNLAVAGSQKDRVEALKKIGLKPGDVDMKGETVEEAFARVRKGLDTIPEGDRAGILNKLVEGANIGEFYAFTEGAAETAKIKAGLSDSRSYEQDVKTMTTGRVPTETKLQNQIENADADRGSYERLYRKAYEAELKDRQVSARYLQQRLAHYDSGVAAGLSPEQATQYNTEIGQMHSHMGRKTRVKEEAAATETRFQAAAGGADQADQIRGDYRRGRETEAQIPIQNYGAPGTPGPNASAAEVEAFRRSIAPTVNVNVNMPGGAAPAKPVPASKIGAKP